MLEGFAPIADAAADTLILGSMPGVASLRQQQYYAHPRNAFWPILEALYEVPADSPYRQRAVEITRHKLALWDVMKHCRRDGSLDSNIQADSIVTNDFASLFAQHPGIDRVFFNGAAAEREYLRRVLPTLPSAMQAIALQRLPSTSPANAQLSFEQKLEQWAALTR